MLEFGVSHLNISMCGAGSMSEEPGFYNFNTNGYFWTSTAIDNEHAWCREFGQWPDPGRFNDDKKMKFSVRCIKRRE